MTAPKALHDFDELFAGVRNLATYYGTFYTELLKHMEPASALQVTLRYVTEFSASARQPKPPEEPKP